MISEVRIEIDAADVEVIGYPREDDTHLVKIHREGANLLVVTYYMSSWWDSDGTDYVSHPIGDLPDCFPDIASSKEWHPCTCGHHICFLEKEDEGDITGTTKEVLALPFGVTVKT